MDEKDLVEQPGAPVHLDEGNFQAAVAKYNFLVVDFWAPWCGPCRMLGPVIENLARKHKGSIVFGKVNVDENAGLAGTYGIMSIPTLVVFKNGEKVEELVGALAEPVLEQKILARK